MAGNRHHADGAVQDAAGYCAVEVTGFHRLPGWELPRSTPQFRLSGFGRICCGAGGDLRLWQPHLLTVLYRHCALPTGKATVVPIAPARRVERQAHHWPVSALR